MQICDVIQYEWHAERSDMTSVTIHDRRFMPNVNERSYSTEGLWL